MPSEKNYLTLKKKPKLIARANYDQALDAEDKARKFYTLEGNCALCGCGPYSLVIYDVVPNKKNKKESIFRFLCTVCDHKDMAFSKDIITVGDKGPNDTPRPPEEA